MPTKPKTKSRTKTASKNKKSRVSSKLLALIIISVVALAGVAFVFSSFAARPIERQKTSNAVGKTMCKKYKNNKSGTYIDYDAKTTLNVYLYRFRYVDCFYGSDGFTGYAKSWSRWQPVSAFSYDNYLNKINGLYKE